MRNIIFVGAFLLASCAHISLPRLDGGCPYEYPVKGNADSFLYHTPDSPFYDRTHAEVCFSSPEAAKKNGYKAAKR